MATVTELREGIAERLATITGLRVHDTVPDTVSPPAAVVRPDQGTFLTYDTTMGGESHDYLFVVTVLVAGGVDRAAQEAVDAYLATSGARSIHAALEADPELGGVADDAHVSSARNYGPVTFAGVDYFGADLLVQVKA